jgi:two-component system, NarL family, sensor histidine kinase DesK
VIGVTTTDQQPGARPIGAAAVDAAPAADGGPGVRQPGKFGWVFSCIWLVYLWYPLTAAWADPYPFWRVLGVASTLAFAGLFAWFFVTWRALRLAGGPLEYGRVLQALVVGVGLLALAAPAAHDEALAGTVYLAVISSMSLPLRRALGVVAVLALAVLVLPRVLPNWHNEDQLVFSLLLASFAAFGVGQVIARNSELLRAREQLVELAVAKERARLARDVHDILGHSLTVITVKTELAGRLLEAVGPDPRLDRARAEVTDVEGLARAALADVRATAAGTRQVSLAGELASARQALEAAGITADLPVAAEVVPVGARELFAWTVREGVTNVVRHSGARWCGIRLTADCIEVRDDGRGPTPADGGSGLRGLRERAEAAGGHLATGTAPEGGFLLQVTTA